VREALFSMLGVRIEGAGFLDLFAGSGAVGIEAWSRGAEPVLWVESSRRVLPTLKENVETLCGGKGRVVVGDAFRLLRKRLVAGPFGVIFADPPYRGRGPGADAGRRDGVLPGLLDLIAAGDILAPGGLFVIEQEGDAPPASDDRWDMVEDRAYGDTRLRMFRRSGTVAPEEQKGRLS
jgi:16S rRNA (guanine966-N2)-methyltransferase